MAQGMVALSDLGSYTTVAQVVRKKQKGRKTSGERQNPT